jgi:hypothetical protein
MEKNTNYNSLDYKSYDIHVSMQFCSKSTTDPLTY